MTKKTDAGTKPYQQNKCMEKEELRKKKNWLTCTYTRHRNDALAMRTNCLPRGSILYSTLYSTLLSINLWKNFHKFFSTYRP